MALALRFLGSDRNVAIRGERPGPGRVNYLLGSDPAGWHTNLPTYGEIVYRDLWPGADLRLRGESGTLKYEFRLAPGADVSRIRLGYRGQQRLSLGQNGELRIETALGLLRDARPVSYQQIGGRRVAVESRFALGRGGAYGFTVGAYDRRYPLVIDPGLLYSTFLGGSGGDGGRDIAVDGAGSAYLTGTTSLGLPDDRGRLRHDLQRRQLRRLRDEARRERRRPRLLQLPGRKRHRRRLRHRARRRRQRLPHWGDASADFPTTAGAFDTTFNGGGFDAFVTKLDASGAALGYSTYLGGSRRRPRLRASRSTAPAAPT